MPLQHVSVDHSGDAAKAALIHADAEPGAAPVLLLAGLLVDGLDRQHHGEDEGLVLAIGDVDGELLPDGELANHPGHQLAAAADGVVAAVEMAARLELAEGR